MVSEERIGEWIGELTESEVQDLDIALAVSLGMKCGPGQLDTDTLEHLNNLQAELNVCQNNIQNINRIGSNLEQLQKINVEEIIPLLIAAGQYY